MQRKVIKPVTVQNKLELDLCFISQQKILLKINFELTSNNFRNKMSVKSRFNKYFWVLCYIYFSRWKCNSLPGEEHSEDIQGAWGKSVFEFEF